MGRIYTYESAETIAAELIAMRDQQKLAQIIEYLNQYAETSPTGKRHQTNFEALFAAAPAAETTERS
jgi:hypothetical protein